MKVADFLHKTEQEIPTKLALNWDNVGLLLGDEQKSVQTIYLALDATDEVIQEACCNKADLLVTHHPLLFTGIKQVVQQDFIGRRLIKLIQNDVSYVALHTNFDVQLMGWLAGEQLVSAEWRVLDVTSEEAGEKKGIGCVADLSETVTLYEMAERCKRLFDISSVKIFGEAETSLHQIAISPGSGKSEVDVAVAAGAQVLITGDIDHHTGIDAVAKGLCVIDAGHYGLEHLFVSYMKQWIHENFPECEVIEEPRREPFWVI